MDKYTHPTWPDSALLTVDIQEDFSRKHAPYYIDGTEKIIPESSKFVQYYRNQHWPIVHIIRLYHPDGSNVDRCRKNAVEQGANIVPPGSHNAELVSELKPDNSISFNASVLLKSKPQKLAKQEWAIYKPRWGGFFKTGLEKLLQKLNISTIVVTGCNFPNCPRTTIYEASERDYRIVLVKNAVSGTYARGIKELQNISVAIYDTEEIISNTKT